MRATDTRNCDTIVEAVAAVAGGPEGFAEDEFGLGVLGAVGAHYTRDGFALGNGRSFVADIFDVSMVSFSARVSVRLWGLYLGSRSDGLNVAVGLNPRSRWFTISPSRQRRFNYGEHIFTDIFAFCFQHEEPPTAYHT